MDKEEIISENGKKQDLNTNQNLNRTLISKVEPKSKLKKIIENMSFFCDRHENFVYILIIVIIGLIISIPLLNNKINVLRDDGIQHIIRIQETVDNLKKFESSKVFINLCNGFGYSWDLFYGNFTSIIPAIIALIIGSSISAFKIFLSLLLVLSGITMYISCTKIFKNKKIGVISAIIYMNMPYHLTDLYMRYAAAEFASFVFIPLVFAGLNSILNVDENEKKGRNIDNDSNNEKCQENRYDKDYILLIIGASGLIITHLLSTMITAIFAIIYLIFNFKKLLNKKVIKKLLISILVILMITAYYWIPMLENSISTDYEVYESGKMSTAQSLNYHRVELKSLITTESTAERVYELGILMIALLLLTPFVIKKIDKKNKKNYILFFAFAIISIIFTTKLINWEKMPELFLMMQFPWRMLEFSSMFLSMIGAVNFYYSIKKFEKKDIIYIVIISLLLTYMLEDKIEYSDEEVEEPSIGQVFDGISGKTNAGAAKFEYLPVKAYESLDKYISTREDKIYVLSGDVNIIEENKDGKNLAGTIEINDDEVKLELPYVYYLGYSVYINNEKVEYSESENGFIEVDILNCSSETVSIEVKYDGTNLMKVSYVISIIGIIFVLLLFLKNDKKNKKGEL